MNRVDWHLIRNFDPAARRQLAGGEFQFRQRTPDRVRVDADFSATPFKAKTANAEQVENLPASSRRRLRLVIGPHMEAGQVSMRLHHGGPQGAKPKAEVVAGILASIKERRA